MDLKRTEEEGCIWGVYIDYLAWGINQDDIRRVAVAVASRIAEDFSDPKATHNPPTECQSGCVNQTGWRDADECEFCIEVNYWDEIIREALLQK